MDNPGEITRLCRLCLVKDEVNIPIFDEQNDIRQIFLKISSCLPVKVSRDDKLPKKICDGCSCKLDLLYEFWNTSANSEKTLLSWLGQAGVKKTDADHKLSAVVQQVANKPETLVKQEAVDPNDGHPPQQASDDSMLLNFQEKFSYEEDTDAGPSETTTKDETEAPPPKRARRTAAVKAQINITAESDDDEDMDNIEPMTKVEDESEESEGEDQEPSFADVPGTSTDDQPGPSGVGKDASLEAPFFDTSILNNLICGPGISITPIKPEIIDCSGYNDFYNYNLGNNSSNVFNGFNPAFLPKMVESELKVEDNDLSKDIKADENILACLLKKKKTKNIKHNRKNEKHPAPVELDEPIQCDVCNKTYKNNVAFAIHSIEHSDDSKYSCHLCDYKNSSKYHIEMHVRAHEGTTKYKCEICGKAFTISTHAIEHKYFHTGEKPFQCEICGKHFMFSWFLTSHRRTQHWEIVTGSPLVKYDCLICNKHYTSSTGLKRHNLSHHGAKGADASVLCDICGKRLSSKEKLKFHRRIHTGYKPFACEICSKSFSRKEQLKEHERVHTGEKPYICKWCGKGFTQRSPLRIHERTHTGERPYKCMICDKGFISKGVMDTHMRSCSIARTGYEPQLNL